MSISWFFCCCCRLMSCRLVKDWFCFMGGKEGCFTCSYSSRVFTGVALANWCQWKGVKRRSRCFFTSSTDMQIFWLARGVWKWVFSLKANDWYMNLKQGMKLPSLKDSFKSFVSFDFALMMNFCCPPCKTFCHCNCKSRSNVTNEQGCCKRVSEFHMPPLK